MSAGMHAFETDRISGGHFVRASDGVDAATVAITGAHGLVISGGTLKVKVAAPAHGHELKVGTHIGGIYAGDNNPAKASHPTLTIAADTVIKLDTEKLSKGTYTAANFACVDAGDGRLQIVAPIAIGGPKLPYSGTLDTSGRLTIVVH